MRNRSTEETSPYLKQHADNPVHWHAWNDEALDGARKSGKPILLSVGYSACHWCHVMAHESFEDEATAQLMNDLYVNIKVDREERPDLDKIYQTSHQLMTGQAGGWPLTVFLTPEQIPIFTGTYFPKERRYGMPAFREVLVAIDEYYRGKRDEVRERGASLVEALGNMQTASADDFAALSPAPLATARERVSASYDAEHGGFGGGPKFPHTTMLELLLAHWHAHRAGAADSASARDGHAHAGLHGRARPLRPLGRRVLPLQRRPALVDPALREDALRQRAAPGPLRRRVRGDGTARYASVASATADWVMRDMQDARGGYYSTLDADSEHEEGKFYVWTPAKNSTPCSPPTRRRSRSACSASTPPAEFRRQALAPAPCRGTRGSGRGARLDAPRAGEQLEAARGKLLAAREQRVWPGRDEKLLVSWNGLMIAGMARAARVLDRPELADPPTRAVDFIRAELWQDGRLKATYKDGRARFAAYLDDYAFLAHGLLELLQYRWRDGDLAFARRARRRAS